MQQLWITLTILGAMWLYGTDTRPYGGHISMLSGDIILPSLIKYLMSRKCYGALIPYFSMDRHIFQDSVFLPTFYDCSHFYVSCVVYEIFD